MRISPNPRQPAHEWWFHFVAYVDADRLVGDCPKWLRPLAHVSTEFVTCTVEEAEDFRRWAKRLPGWRKRPLIFETL